ncbi:LemA family protein [Paracrocinitomix mangrovi]|uniref:LemA family protein n=1 Tax=Paracrocinitomix mangrovi TaxID=2862509 RepID=UPI001C8EA41C|nr:LemA family protein [Paracrocinitomix mangrovi]UKN00555.1 LemA family protein [Paracrocinitomix mangrovi]
MIAGIVIGAVVLILILWFVSLYNTLQRLETNREQAFADIDVQLKQRHDLIPQLVATVKGYAQQEEKVLTQVTQARARAMSAGTVNEKIAAEAALAGAMSQFSMQMEAYPDLKSNTNFLQLQNEMSDIENKLSAVRRFFNSATKALNVKTKTFPSNIVARMAKISEEPFFDLGVVKREELDEAPKVEF